MLSCPQLTPSVPSRSCPTATHTCRGDNDSFVVYQCHTHDEHAFDARHHRGHRLCDGGPFRWRRQLSCSPMPPVQCFGAREQCSAAHRHHLHLTRYCCCQANSALGQSTTVVSSVRSHAAPAVVHHITQLGLTAALVCGGRGQDKQCWPLRSVMSTSWSATRCSMRAKTSHHCCWACTHKM